MDPTRTVTWTPPTSERPRSYEKRWRFLRKKVRKGHAPICTASLKITEHKVWATLSNSESNAGWIWDWALDNAADTKWQVAQRHTNRDRLETDVSNSKMFFLFKKITESHLGHFDAVCSLAKVARHFPHFCVRWFSTHAFYQLFHQLDSQFTVPVPR